MTLLSHRSAHRSRRRSAARIAFLLALLLTAVTACQPPAAAPQRTGTPGHIFVINLENKGFDRVWGNGSPAPYLSGTLRAQGVLLDSYYGVSHNSLPNYLAQISGQPPNSSTEHDCHTYTPFSGTGLDSQGQLLGDGCLFPAEVPTLAGQLDAAHKTWRGYMEDMATPCEHPQPDAVDTHVAATAGDQYATRHNPFVYFRSITDGSGCGRNVVNYSALAHDLSSAATTPNLSYITPNLCHDGHDSPCVDGTAGGLGTADEWLKSQVPAILASPAYQQDGMLVITFDEADGGAVGPSSGVTGGTAGGKVGALVLSPFTVPGGSSDRAYNHYSLLASMEDIFGLPRLAGAAQPGVNAFGGDVYRSGSQGQP
ncbi:alkaline phosphatase family protein [Arthrobacter sp. YD4]|uniref:alkaline phosphatase family protein n=1 Tax=Arthrobacter sp. YD4 TaxID=3058043 RepID=UPI0025B587BF|nr:alkaline phosphatase family protein [Arthrobacter sp. YD4]MDN3936969.1 alkaline phosphatase family protein [Arthrobacter sp. YD4]